MLQNGLHAVNVVHSQTYETVLPFRPGDWYSSAPPQCGRVSPRLAAKHPTSPAELLAWQSRRDCSTHEVVMRLVPIRFAYLLMFVASGIVIPTHILLAQTQRRSTQSQPTRQNVRVAQQPGRPTGAQRSGQPAAASQLYPGAGQAAAQAAPARPPVL
jgi:hypothetical protein